MEFSMMLPNPYFNC